MEHFLEDVTQSDLEAVLAIKDELKLCVKDKIPVGDLTISKTGDAENFEVCLLSEAKFENLTSKSEVNATIKKNFNVVQQEYAESMEQTQGEFVTRHTKIRCEDGLFVVLQGKNSLNCDVIAEFQDKKGILGELGSMVFESLLARIGFHQEIKLDWLLLQTKRASMEDE